MKDIKELIAFHDLHYSDWISPIIGCCNNIRRTISDIFEKTAQIPK